MRILNRIAPIAFAVAAAFAAPAAGAASVAIGISVSLPPPPLPVYVQPPIPGPRYMWVPGHWSWGTYGYYWVPGAWVLPPAVGLLWTPGYWGWRAGVYAWHPGYWAHHVGFYGGINYGFGYTGVGFVGGYWHNGVFIHNTAVTNIRNVHITNVYYHAVPAAPHIARVSFNGGPRGVHAAPRPDDRAYAHERHWAATAMQRRHEGAIRAAYERRGAAHHGPEAMRGRGGPHARPMGNAHHDGRMAEAHGPHGHGRPDGHDRDRDHGHPSH